MKNCCVRASIITAKTCGIDITFQDGIGATIHRTEDKKIIKLIHEKGTTFNCDKTASDEFEIKIFRRN